jgi:hypothetical protein
MMKPNGSKQHRSQRRQKPRSHGGGHTERKPVVSLTEEGVPAAVPDAIRPSAAVFVSDQARAVYPWLPPRVIAGSVWRGPRNERVKVDEAGNAIPWRARPAPVR